MSALDRVTHIEREVEEAVARATSTSELEQIRVRYLGRKAELPNLLRQVAQLPAEQRAATGKAANEARQSIAARIDERAAELAAKELQERLEHDRVDVTLPADPLSAIGHLHLITQTRREIEDVFVGLGFTVEEGPDVETAYYNFDALNTPVTHPSRLETDTFYVKPPARGPGRGAPADLDIFDPSTLLLRVHTSPMQIRAMEQAPPPLYVIVPGRAYRPDSDATHAPQFHQVEGLAVDTDVTLADLKGTLLRFARAIFGEDREVRVRPHFFPFTEPSVELDVSCFNCVDGITADGERCPLCKGTAWIELLGAGMVDPNVFEYVRENGYDPERVQGFAFGMGIERIAQLKHGVPDLRLLYDNDIRFLEQF
jgi:phenylalanyl-tRNA synthetase alpha chain